MEYEEVVQWFKPREQKITLGLERMRRACSLFHNVEKSLRCAHVAGTNGKGSICFKIANVFQIAGYKVGLYLSPHISSMCERIQINNKPILENELARLVELVRLRDPLLSAFEVLTVVAFLWYAENSVDFTVLEVGLGGLLDATNVCYPDVSVITSISFDHMDYLGNTLHSITENKAGIIKEGVPVVIGPKVPFNIIEQRAKQVHSSFYRVKEHFLDYDEENNAVAKQTLQILQEKWSGLDVSRVSQFHLPCRFEEVSKEVMIKKIGENAPRVILDVAHNPDGIDMLLKKLQQKAVFLCSICRNKDVLQMVSLLLSQSVGFVCTQAPGERAMCAKELGKIALDMKSFSHVRIEADPEEALIMSFVLARKAKVPLVITGTFYLMEQIKHILRNE